MKMRLNQKIVDALDPENPGDFWDTELTGFGVRVLSASKYYALRYTTKAGKRTTMKIGDAVVMPLAVARSEAKQVLGAVESGGDPNAEKKQVQAETLTLGAFLNETYGPWLATQRKRGQDMVTALLKSATPLLEIPLPKITQIGIERWRKSLLDGGASRSTLNVYTAYLSGAMTHAVKWDLLKSNPCTGIQRFKLDNTRVRILSDVEQARLFIALEERQEKMRLDRDNMNQWRIVRHMAPLPDLRAVAYTDHLMPGVIISLNTGGRRAEVLGMEWRELDMERQVWCIAAARAKSDKARFIPLNATAWECIQNMRVISGTSKWVFPNEVGNGPVLDLKHAFQKMLAAANIGDGFVWHSMRHCFCSRMLESGCDVETLRTMTGHHDLAILMRYLHSSDLRRAEAIQKMEAMDAPADNIVSFQREASGSN